MNVKKDLMAEIEAKAKKMKERKAKGNTKAELEKLVYEFFTEAESLGKMKEHILLHEAGQQLQRKIASKIDFGARVEVNYTEEGQVQGVLIHWSKSYQVSYKTEETFYIGVEQMLFN